MKSSLLSALLLFAFLLSDCAAQQWQAGSAKANITPKQTMWMSGYGGRNKPAEGTLHELWAKVLVLKDPQGTPAIFVSLDLVGVSRDIGVPVCDAIQKAHKVNRGQIALFTSHTHTGPVVGSNLSAMYFLDETQQKLVDDYAAHLIQVIPNTVTEAFRNLKPAQVSYGIGSAGFAVNRRNNREADVPKLREQGQLQGPVDHAAPVIAVRDQGGKLQTVVFGYACHATVLSFYQWSGDWPGFAQIEIEKRHPGVTALFMAGCGADQNPLPRRTVELAAGYGTQMADAVDKVLSGEMTALQKGLRSAWTEIPLALAELPMKESIQKDSESSNKFIAGRAKQLLGRIAADGQLSQTYPYPVQTWNVGGLRLVILGGEVVVDYSLRLKNEFPETPLFVSGYSNDVMAYIPSVRVLKEGGYEGASSMIYYGQPTVWSERVEGHIIETVHQQMKQVAP